MLYLVCVLVSKTPREGHPVVTTIPSSRLTDILIYCNGETLTIGFDGRVVDSRLLSSCISNDGLEMDLDSVDMLDAHKII